MSMDQAPPERAVTRILELFDNVETIAPLSGMEFDHAGQVIL